MLPLPLLPVGVIGPILPTIQQWLLFGPVVGKIGINSVDRLVINRYIYVFAANSHQPKKWVMNLGFNREFCFLLIFISFFFSFTGFEELVGGKIELPKINGLAVSLLFGITGLVFFSFFMYLKVKVNGELIGYKFLIVKLLENKRIGKMGKVLTD